jgi:hypothetical protein
MADFFYEIGHLRFEYLLPSVQFHKLSGKFRMLSAFESVLDFTELPEVDPDNDTGEKAMSHH